MTNQSVSRRRRLRRRAGLRLALLALPALFWAAVFTALAGLRLPGAPHGGAVAGVPLVLAAAACPLLAVVLLGPASLKRGTPRDFRSKSKQERFKHGWTGWTG